MLGRLLKSMTKDSREVPEGLPDEVNINYLPNFVGVHHRGMWQAGFKDINWVHPEIFADILREGGLDPDEMFKIRGGNIGDYLFLWANERVLVISETNPLTDEADCGDFPGLNTAGYGLRIGIEGRKRDVELIYERMQEEAMSIEGQNPESREFL